MDCPLPDDVATLQVLLLTQQSEIEHLKLLVLKFRRMLFGKSAETMTGQVEQFELYIDEKAQDVAQVEAELAARQPQSSPRHGRRALPEHLPREIIEHLPKATCCPDCGGALKPLGEDISEVLDYVPASFRVQRHVRPKLACAKCDVIVQADAPSRPIQNGMASAGLLAQVLVAKYCDHLPLYRQSEIYARQGVELERSTLADWVAQCHHLLSPLTAAIRRHVLAASKIHGDDTPVPVLAPSLGQTKTGRLWVYVRDDRPAGDETPPAVWFAYSPNRKGEHPQTHLLDFRGVLQADAFAGFAPLYETGGVREAACWAHVRRKFYDLHQAQASPLATEAVKRIGALYAIEQEIRGQPPDVRRTERQARAGPLLDAIHVWMETSLRGLSQKSKLAEAIRYALGRWGALTRYVGDGVVEIDNNAAERALRCVALGRKNFLFAGSDAGGERAASVYSLIGTAKLCGIEPQAYLRHVIGCIADHPINRVEELLPWNVTAQLA
jgi:transposase